MLIECDHAAAPLVIAVTSHLDPACDYTGGVTITASDITFDCQGAVIRGTTSGTGITIVSPVDVDMSNVTVQNCRTAGFLNGIRMTRTGFRDLAAGVEYEHHLRDIVIKDTSVVGSRGVGVYVDAYVTRVTLTGLIVSGAGSTGIYLETGSRENTVAGNSFINNGFVENGPGGSLYDFGGTTLAFWGTGREGLAIDGSSNNVVRDNWFHGNSAGGIFLYTNCGEYPDRTRYFERRYPSDRNVITNNVFDSGWTGVWVGSRMGENVFPMECSNVPYFEAPVTQYTLDRAADNVIRGNQFNGPDYGVRVEDDGTQVLDNLFLGPDAGHHAIVVGTPYRTQYLSDPVHNTRIQGNKSEIVGNPNPFRWVHGVDGLVDLDNTALGLPTAICEGVTLPRGPFVMALEVGLPNPDGSIPPRPDLAFPVLGPLPPCVGAT
ncbi:MAG: right-handed parallel beta-helix repeat-containing protein [Acidimicrobiia bacterium]|nr:right-handed parallel beta-helix repeat-containing protein [Acidimicrobiia bacterium]